MIITILKKVYNYLMQTKLQQQYTQKREADFWHPVLKLHSKGIGQFNYYYQVVGDDCFDSIEKIFFNQHDTYPSLFWTLLNTPPPKYTHRLPALIGSINGRVKYLDISRGNLLVAGRTRSGKTCFLNSFILSLLLFSHHQYLRLVCLDSKRTSFKVLGKDDTEGADMDELRGVASVATTAEEISAMLQLLNQKLDERLAFLEPKRMPTTITEANAYAYRAQNKENVTPYIVVVFDEFADYLNLLAEHPEEKKKALTAIDRLAAMGIAAGIHLVFATQSPYRKWIAGSVKANMQHRLTFALSDRQQAELVLGSKKDKAEMCATDLQNGGYFLYKEGSKRVAGRAYRASWRCLANAAKTLASRGIDFSI